MKTPERTVIQWLKVIARRKDFSVYTGGVKLFVENIEKKKPAQLVRLCYQIKEVILCNYALAVNLFGIGAVNFFEAMDIHKIIWTKKKL
jgi:hypothetical protein